jgi:Membrane protein involved in colicin uptake
MKLNKVAKAVALLAVTIPLTVLSARADFNDDFQSYSQNLQARIYGGRASGRLNNSEYNRLMGLWTQVEAVNRQFRGRTPNPQERNSLMASLTTLDRDLTNNLHDNQFSRFQYWDSSRSDWKADSLGRMRNLLPIGSGTGNYNDEIDAYQRNLKLRLDQARGNGTLNPRDFNRLNEQLRQVDLAQRDFKSNGYNYWERNNLMSLLTNLDREITGQLRDNNMSRYQYWNQDTFSWNQPWWQSGWQGGGAVIPVADQGAYDDQIDAYEWNLRDRLQRGFSSGRITQSELNRIQSQLDEFDRQQWQYRYKGSLDFNDRNRLMSTLVSIDKNLSRQLNDNESRYQYWNASNNSWTNNWWGNILTGNVASNNNYDEEIEAYRNNIRNRINSGRNGRLTPSEYNRLNTSYQSFENLYNRYRAKGINPWERSSLMNMLSSLDRDVVAQLKDNDQSRYQYWNPNKQNWNQANQQWWRSNNNNNNNRNDRDRNDRVGNNWNDNNNNNNWRDRDRNDNAASIAAKQAAEKAARDAATREAAERAARDAAARSASEKATRDAAEKATRDAAEKAARDAARNEHRNDGDWRSKGNRGQGWNRGRDNDNNNGNNGNSFNNRPGNDNQASDNNNNDDRGRGRGRGKHNRDNNDNN